MTTIKLRRGTQSEWDAANPVLADGEQGYITDTGETKTGDGVTAFADLPADFSGTYGNRAVVSVAASDAPQFFKNAADYVADGTDDDVEIASAIADLPAGGGEVLLSTGTFNGYARLTKVNVTLRGSGWGTVVKTKDGASKLDDDAPVRVLANGCHVADLTCDGNSENNGTLDREADGIGIYADDVTVERCQVHNFMGHGIIVWNEEFAAESVAAAPRRRVTVRECRVFAGASTSSRAMIESASTDNTVELNEDILFVGNDLDAEGNDSTVKMHTGRRFTVSGNFCSNGDIVCHSGAAGPTAGDFIQIVGNHMNAGTIQVREGYTDVAIVGNTAIDSGATRGVQIDDCKRATVSGNVLRNTGRGVDVQTGSTDVAVANNVIDSMSAEGIRVRSLSERVIISGNVVEDTAGTSAIEIDDSHRISIVGNRLRSFVKGVHRSNGAPSQLSIKGNHISTSTTSDEGARLQGVGDKIILSDNEFEDVGNAVSVNSTGNVHVTDNTFRNVSRGIRVDGSGNEVVRILGNHIENTVGEGIRFFGSMTIAEVRHNHMKGTGGAVDLANATTLIRSGNVGHETEASGTDTIADTSATVGVSHGLTETPTSVTITPRGNDTLWVSARGASTFTVERSGTSGALDFDWKAEV